ncbi:hypothetical protein [Nocardia sp. CC201C]|uniref:hypothetical protein n=1 Tax=Nocardia sp. CC201C TaxID=3044575 RepID=UPI0024A7BB1B|nr:hypothetical protein [Nocardia sp. CC201C]
MPPRTRQPKTAAPLPAEDVDTALTVINTPDQVIPPVVDDDARPIPAALQFTTGDGDEQASEEIAEEDILEFSVDGHVLVAIKPSPEQWGVMMAMLSKSATMAERIHAMQQFASHVLDEPSYLYVEGRLLDRRDRFGTEVYTQMLNAIIEHFSPQLSRRDRRRLARDMHR